MDLPIKKKLYKFQNETHIEKHYKLSKEKRKENIENHKRQVTHDIQGIFNKIISRYNSRNFAGQKAVEINEI